MQNKRIFAEVVSFGILMCLCSNGFGQEVYFIDMSPPYVWSIEPNHPTTSDVIHIRGPFSYPLYYYQNYCYATAAAGCEPDLRVLSSSVSIICGAQVPPGIMCPAVWDPVNAVECIFGPLPAGNWTFYTLYPLTGFYEFGFAVLEPITVLKPNGGEYWPSGSSQQVVWEPGGNTDAVGIEYSTDNGGSWQTVDPNAPNTGSYQWTVPDANSQQCLVRVSKVGDPALYDVSDNVFTIYPCDRDLSMDFNGDCYVDFADFALFAGEWSACGNPYDLNCW